MFSILILNLLLIKSSQSQKQFQNMTIQLCCQQSEFFNIRESKCESMPQDIKVKWDLKIDYPNKTEKELNILDNFKNKIHLPCKKAEVPYFNIKKSTSIHSMNNTQTCFTPYYLRSSKQFVVMQLDCSWKLKMVFFFKHKLLYFFSDILLIPTLIIYVSIKQLNSSLMGKCFITYLCSLSSAHYIYLLITLFLHINYHMPNIIYISIAFMNTFFYISTALWTNILGIDAWIHFRNMDEELDHWEKKKRFIFYSIYAWISSVIIFAPDVFRNFTTIQEYCNKTLYSKSCAMFSYYILSKDVYYAPATMSILIINFLIFCCIAWKIYSIRRESAVAMQNRELDNSTIFLRLFILMCPYWILKFLFLKSVYHDIVVIGIKFFHSTSVFVLFVLKGKVLKLLFK